MSDVAAAPATNGSASKTTAPVTTTPTQDVATGTQTSSGPTRGSDGKFTSTGAPQEGRISVSPPAKLKIKDREYNEEDAWKEIERGRNSARLLTEAEKRNKAAEARERALEERKSRFKEKKDLAILLEEFELSPEEEQELLAARLYGKHIAPTQMTPEQRELSELKAKLAERDESDKKTAAQKQEELNKFRRTAEAKKLETEILEAARAGRIPSTPAAMRRIIQKAVAFDERGMELPLDQIARIVRDEVAVDVCEFTDSMEVADLAEMLGPERFKKHELKMLRHLQTKLKAPAVQQAVRAPPQVSTEKRQYITPQAWAEQQRRNK